MVDGVTRTVYYKYFHPKEVCVMNGVLNRELNRAAGKQLSKDIDERKYKSVNNTRYEFYCHLDQFLIL